MSHTSIESKYFHIGDVTEREFSDFYTYINVCGRFDIMCNCA